MAIIGMSFHDKSGPPGFLEVCVQLHMSIPSSDLACDWHLYTKSGECSLFCFLMGCFDVLVSVGLVRGVSFSCYLMSPRPLAFRLRSQDPWLILALGDLQWARGSSKGFLSSPCFFVTAGAAAFPCLSSLFLVAMRGVFSFRLFVVLPCVLSYVCCACAWGVFVFQAVLGLNVCVCV